MNAIEKQICHGRALEHLEYFYECTYCTQDMQRRKNEIDTWKHRQEKILFKNKQLGVLD